MADARSLTWLGVPTDDTGAALRFFTEQLGLEPEVHEGDFAGDAGRRWSHFRGPDGYLFELTQLPC